MPFPIQQYTRTWGPAHFRIAMDTFTISVALPRLFTKDWIPEMLEQLRRTDRVLSFVPIVQMEENVFIVTGLPLGLTCTFIIEPQRLLVSCMTVVGCTNVAFREIIPQKITGQIMEAIYGVGLRRLQEAGRIRGAVKQALRPLLPSELLTHLYGFLAVDGMDGSREEYQEMLAKREGMRRLAARS